MDLGNQLNDESGDDPIPAEELEFQNAAATASCGPETSAPADRTSPAS